LVAVKDSLLVEKKVLALVVMWAALLVLLSAAEWVLTLDRLRDEHLDYCLASVMAKLKVEMLVECMELNLD